MSRYKIKKYPPKNSTYVGRFLDKDTGNMVLMYQETVMSYVIVDPKRRLEPQWFLRKKDRKRG